MAFATEEEHIRFTIRMALASISFAPKPERREHVRIAQTDAILEALERSGYAIVKVREDPMPGPSTIWESQPKTCAVAMAPSSGLHDLEAGGISTPDHNPEIVLTLDLRSCQTALVPHNAAKDIWGRYWKAFPLAKLGVDPLEA